MRVGERKSEKKKERERKRRRKREREREKNKIENGKKERQESFLVESFEKIRA